jgi:predicted AAA+ superfamily ATPase
LTSLKYFCENAPEYHVVCAGSLLGIALSKPLSFPVGKVDFLTLYPMNFQEFLLANGEEALCAYWPASPPNTFCEGTLPSGILKARRRKITSCAK